MFLNRNEGFRQPFAGLVAAMAFVVALTCLVSLPAGSALAFTGISDISVNSNKILLNGADTRIEGFIFQTFVEVEDQVELCKDSTEYCARTLQARDFYFGRGQFKNQSGLQLAKQLGANTIRLNLNQAALDPDNPNHAQSYLPEIVQAVSLARKDGFGVILALFDGRNTNAPGNLMKQNPATPIDDQTTLDAAKVLAKQFGSDKGIVLELLNEPWSPAARRIGWKLWRDGGTPQRGRFAGKKFVGVNPTIAAIRAEGAQNVILLQGIGASFKGFPDGISDPLNRVAFSVHPFFENGDPKRLNWDANFGRFAQTHPFLISAWNSPARKGWCAKLGFKKPQQFLDYLHKNDIGLVAYALDVPGTILKDFRVSTTDVSGYGKKCSDGGAAGSLIINYFKNP